MFFQKSVNVKKNVSLKPLHTFALEAKANYLYHWEKMARLPVLLNAIEQYDRVQFLGAGSNTLFLKDFDGLVVHVNTKGIQPKSIGNDQILLTVAAGEKWNTFVQYCVAQGWYGLENLTLIPGSVGATPVQNIGAYGVEAKNFITRVFGVDIRTRQNFVLDAIDCCFAYRQSIFKKQEFRNYLITAVEFKLSTKFEPQLSYGNLEQVVKEIAGYESINARHVTNAVRQIRMAKLPNPSIIPNAGSFFMNPTVSAQQASILLQKYPEMPHFEYPDHTCKLAAGWLIDKAGLKGITQGGVAMHDQQALVMVNQNNATAQDVLALKDLVQQKVFQKFGVMLEPEPVFVQ
ncbi:MAG: UDP-N-acetylmuramate dehydrogenase [Neisseriaceae bacterium]|nr:UDP-N-acetylmuramate dehydrogenase [Neisseriaceae bacterium]